MDLAPPRCTDNTCDDHRRCFVDDKSIQAGSVNFNLGLQRARLELALVLALLPAEHGNSTRVKERIPS